MENRPNITRRQFLVASLVSGASLEFAACAPAVTPIPQDYIAKQLLEFDRQGLHGRHKIIDLKSVPGFPLDKPTQQGMLILEKEINGKSTSLLQLAWALNDSSGRTKRFVISEVPLSKVVYEVVDDNEIPNVDFNLDPKLFVSKRIAGMSVTYEITRSDDLSTYIDKATIIRIRLAQKGF